MLRQIIIFYACCVCFSASVMIIRNPGPRFPPTKGEVWPKPQRQLKYNTYYKFVPSVFKFTVTDETCHIVKSAIERYSKVMENTFRIAWRHSRLLRHRVRKPKFVDISYSGVIQQLEISLSSPCEEYPELDMNELYSLSIAAVSTLKSSSVWGILRGMETFVQLMYISKDYKNVFINTTDIIDFPQYPHRGLLIDTGRHYLTVANILKTLDAMEMNKMNVLHWHIVDDESFPYQSDTFPQLSAQGAFDASMVYVKTSINLIVNYARDRGIRVIPEFDVPGHTRSWGAAYPNLLTKCYQNNIEVGLGPMDPTNNMTYKLIGELFEEVQKLFPEVYFHVGGDEVQLECWLSNPHIRDFMETHQMTNAKQLHSYFMSRVIPLLGPKSKPIVWQEVFDEGVDIPKDTIVQVWKNEHPDEIVAILLAGYKVIYSASWYLDVLHSGGDWKSYYKADPRQMIPKNANVNLENIVGGESCMWGEVVDDTNVISRVWPRSSATAERLWSPEMRQFDTPPYEASCRLEEHTCRMNRRGIKAQPPNGPGFCVVY